MGRLIYSMITSLDGYAEDANGDFGWTATEDDVHAFVTEEYAGVGTYLYGSRMYQTMVYWETADQLPDQPQVIYDYARVWQAADKIVYSATLTETASQRTRLERSFDPEQIRRLKAESDHDLTVDGPTLAATAIKAGLVDEIHQIVCPVIVGGGNRFFPEGVRLDLDLVSERRFANGVLHLRFQRKG
ncbi:dihydrofolate reductase family protein [Microlunatus speluncae]|uniref:dihydrofolate reductase family protein n=1 Tax=Microlunatus speluncae TaxID=2594267 RepID=UPI0012667C0C|nr:dihydrofolate reductase family protein [Microlunatus speluncae]